MHIRYVTTKGLSYDFFLNMYYTILHLFIFNVCTKMLLYSLVNLHHVLPYLNPFSRNCVIKNTGLIIF